MKWRYANTVLALCTLAFFATMVARLVISPVVPDIGEAFSVSTSAVGLALTGMWAAYALTQFPSGLLGDRFGERRVILTAVGGTVVTSALLTVVPSYALFVVATVCLGAAAGLHYSVATSLLTRQFADIGRAIGIHVAGGPLAGLLAPVAAALVGARYGWRWALALGVAAAIPVFALFARYVEPTPPRLPDRPMRDRMELRPLAELLSRPQIAYTTGLAVLGAFTWQATASFLPAFLEQGRDLPQTTAGLLFSLYFVVHGLTQPVMGSISDRYPRDLTVAGTMGVGIVGYGLLVVGRAVPVLVVGVVLAGLAMSWGAPLQSRFMDLLGDSERGAGFGLVRTVYMTLGASGSVVVGVVSDLAGWTTAFALLAGLMVVGFASISGVALLSGQ
ncbi:MFS transporter [Halomarina litorea]|uniref:MFS transporter n=1 Tax=Halomarina litorea TaxID=2961595 RepID=UPI0020C2123A|nr:MFS transporter [Halomarina sp. BCD28]